MNRKLRAARIPLFALAVCAALAAGVSSAFAGPSSVPPPVCPRTSIGRCNSLERCQADCAALGGDPATASCQPYGGTSCCFCPIAF